MIEDELNKLAGLYDKKGNPVPAAEIESVRRGTFYEGNPRGLYIGFVIPSKEPLATNVKTASDLAAIPTLTDDEKRNGALQLLGTVLTAPSGYKTDPAASRRPSARPATDATAATSPETDPAAPPSSNDTGND
jgi:hypothetical protein